MTCIGGVRLVRIKQLAFFAAAAAVLQCAGFVGATVQVAETASRALIFLTFGLLSAALAASAAVAGRTLVTFLASQIYIASGGAFRHVYAFRFLLAFDAAEVAF